MRDLSPSIERSPFLSGEHLARLCSRYISIRSVNGEDPERDLALFIASQLDEAGFTTHVVGDERRPSIAAVFGQGNGGVVLNGHLDTVPVDDADEWEHDPFAGVIADGRVHGRGACDMKGGLAVQVAVGQWLAANDFDGRLVLHFAMGEERGEPGTEDLLAADFVAPAGVVLEPTNLQIGVAQRGLVTLSVRVAGRAGHASRPELTHNPVDHLPALLNAIGSLQDRPAAEHPYLGGPQWTATGVHAGTIPSMVPASAEVLVDRRMIPGETVEQVVSDLAETAQEAVPDALVTVEVVTGEGIYEPAEVMADGPAAVAMTEATSRAGVEAGLFGTAYSSDIRHMIKGAGIDAVTFGPGDFPQMHARDEYVAIDDLRAAARSVASFCELMAAR